MTTTIKSSPTYLYFHGGPGLSSFPDQALMKPLQSVFHLEYWNEPSNLRPQVADHFEADQAFRNWMASAENFILGQWMKETGPIYLVAHSFACLPILQIAKRHESKIKGLLLVSPVLDMVRTFRKAVRWAQIDLAKTKSSLVREVEDHLKASREPFDSHMIQALEYALADGEMLLHYWKDRESMENWQSVLVSDSRAGVDTRAWKAVLQDLYWEYSYLQMEPLEVPLAIITGMDDHFGDRAQIEEFLQLNPHCRYESWAGCGHFPHLEDSEEFGRSLYGLGRM